MTPTRKLPASSNARRRWSTGEFTITAPTSSARAYHTSTLLNNGKTLITGGLSKRARFLFSAEVFIPPEAAEIPASVEIVAESTPEVISETAPTAQGSSISAAH